MELQLRTHFRNFGLTEAAIEWLCGLFCSIQMLDDVADNGTIKRDDLDRAINFLLFESYLNPFFSQNSSFLLPLMAVSILKWQASDRAEREGRADARSYMWRAGYYDVILAAVLLCRGKDYAAEHAEEVLGIYGELFKDYMKEFPHA